MMKLESGRLVSQAILTPADFAVLAARSGGVIKARKIGYVAARVAVKREIVESRWNGKETTNAAAPGDVIATNLGPDRQPLRDLDGQMNVYVILADRFPDLYEATGETGVQGPIYKAKSTVEALALPGGFDILAPWGERQVAPRGYLIRNGSDVYGNNAETFEATYELL